jgi:hypothetical protein
LANAGKQNNSRIWKQESPNKRALMRQLGGWQAT